jgi:hypothetical protein
MGQMISVSRDRPPPSTAAPPPSYCTGRDASYALRWARAALRLGPPPDSLPAAQGVNGYVQRLDRGKVETRFGNGIPSMVDSAGAVLYRVTK